MTTMPALIIARLTLREASRRRLLLAVVVLTVIVVGLTAWAFKQVTGLECGGNTPCTPAEIKMIAAILVILITFMFSFVFTVGAVFVTAPAIATEIESGVALAMLPRPIRRSDVILGKWLGLGTLISGYAIATAGLEFLAVWFFVDYTPPNPLGAIAFLVGESLVMLTLALLFSTRLAPMTGGIIALVLFGLGWIGGIAHGVGVALESDAVRNIGVVMNTLLPTDGLWRGALYHLEPAVVIETMGGAGRVTAVNPFFVLSPAPPIFVAWAVVWIAIVLAAAIFSFERREL